MTTFTLDFSSSYRAITDADVLLTSMGRDPYGWNGNGAPELAVTLVVEDGEDVIIPYVNPTDGLDPFLVAHAPGPNRFDLINPESRTVLRFAIPVDGPPLWENYVDASYSSGDGLPDGSTTWPPIERLTLCGPSMFHPMSSRPPPPH